MSKPQSVTLTCPPDRHIPVAFQEIYEVLKARVPLKDRIRFEEVCALVESISSLEFHEMRERLQHNFKQFSAGAKGQILIQRVGKGMPSRAELDEAQHAVVEDVIKLMNKAHFKLLKDEEWENAIEEEFTFTMPVDVNWEAFDDRLLKTYWQSSPENQRVRERLAPIADRILVFHRGVGVATKRDYFFSEKVDILLDYLVGQPVTKLYHMVLKMMAKKQGDAGAAGAGEAAAAAAPPPRKALPRVDSTHKNVKSIERRTLRHVMPTAGAVLGLMFQKIDIQEPTFKDVVILYRKMIPKPKSKQVNVLTTISPVEKLRNVLRRRNIAVRSFGEIPMADIELIFPDKKVFIKTQDRITLLVGIVSAFIAFMSALINGGVTLSVAWSAVSTLGMGLMQLWNNMQAKKAAMAQEMSLQVYDLASDSQEGVLSYLLQEMSEQQLKEAIIAYTLLLLSSQHKASSTSLDNMCEDFLEEAFELKLDFAIEDSLPRLRAWGMVAASQDRKGDILYSAVELEQAMAELQHRWTNFYRNTSQKSLEGPPQPNGLAAVGSTVIGAVGNGITGVGRTLAKPFAGRADFDDDGVSIVSDITYTQEHELEVVRRKKSLRDLFRRKSKDSIPSNPRPNPLHTT